MAKTTFPESAMIGSLGDFARVMSFGTEVPEVFYFTTALTMFGNFCSGKIVVNVAVDADPRLYTILLGDSYLVKKSTAMSRCAAFFETLWKDADPGGQPAVPPKMLRGVGSAEGLARVFQNSSNVILLYDELRALIEKTKVQGSVLLPMITALFHERHWDNPTKNTTVSVSDARLSIAACCTLETYEEVWTREALAMGLPNRLLVVLAEGVDRVAWPAPPDGTKLEKIREHIQGQLNIPPDRKLDITPEAKHRWEEWYFNIPRTIHAKRLDTIGFRLLVILTLTTDKECIDLEVTEAVIAVLNYELAVRTLTDPFDASNRVSKMEQSIRRVLGSKGPCKELALKKRVHYERDGIWCFKMARENLIKEREIRFDTKTGCYELCEEAGVPTFVPTS